MHVQENMPAGTYISGGTISVLDEDAGASVRCSVVGPLSEFFVTVPMGPSNEDGFQDLVPASQTNIAGVNVGSIGAWELRTAAVLDRESATMGLNGEGQVSVGIQCEDENGLQVELQPRLVNVHNVNDQPIILGFESGGTSTTVEENVSLGTEVGVLVVQDPDV